MFFILPTNMQGGTSMDNSNNSALWYVVQSLPKMEIYAANLLKTGLGLNVFLPQGRVVCRQNELKYAPFFPGYLFVQVDLQKVSPSSINMCPGVLHLITFDGELEPIPHTAIEIIHRKVNEFNGAGKLLNDKFLPGDMVRFKEGALQELDMVFLGINAANNRARALINILGHSKEVLVDFNLLEGTLGGLERRRVRYTRGKGRKIKNSGHSS
jgi:transcriptional antiterminator RfaH